MSNKVFIESSQKKIRKILTEGDGKTKYLVPVWELDVQNKNKRTYPKALGERIVNEKRTTVIMDGHGGIFEDDKYGNVKGVGRNPVIEDNYLMFELEFIDDEYQKKVENLIDNDIEIGLSSVGIGETDKDGVIIPESYELIRYADFVMHPAANVSVNKGKSENSTEEDEIEETEEDDESTTVESDDESEIEKESVRLNLKMKGYL